MFWEILSFLKYIDGWITYSCWLFPYRSDTADACGCKKSSLSWYTPLEGSSVSGRDLMSVTIMSASFVGACGGGILWGLGTAKPVTGGVRPATGSVSPVMTWVTAERRAARAGELLLTLNFESWSITIYGTCCCSDGLTGAFCGLEVRVGNCVGFRPLSLSCIIPGPAVIAELDFAPVPTSFSTAAQV